MATPVSLPNAPDLSSEDYLVLGLATCFVKEDGQVQPVEVVEPIPSAALEAIVKGLPTSYHLASATTVGAVLAAAEPTIPATFPPDAHFCDEFTQRAIAAARTYKRRPVAQTIIPLGTTREDFNYSVERKRVLNLQRVVRTEDNVKQHEYTHKVL